ncbi:hypothetical protein EV659_102112 [Rhodothalassium salexigens DSM 2132]|uniref:DUF4139 domain-containing protein n=1 Tax=Rhodothalassium salexigens DSM 2132 TaxID=1188247 RepID=A0A4V2SQ60_RHOSA|nr:DUF4139 domain-containing protein [Rhodothalassium salexigens]MBB4210738.1 hypothetical protein [Rhodothalassium salexigens DSM 2132]MBK1638281.1 hypothetical protein [Rhodothalassium salexigens DSM 2132]TCP37706.1 hypothetical protein EV659_102112 [Rhodothalassium salexigens DSM 2132]
MAQTTISRPRRHGVAALALTALLGSGLGSGAVVLAPAARAADAPGERTATVDQRTGLSLTIYNDDLALVRDARRVDLPRGRTRLAFEGVAPGIDAPTALLKAPGVTLVEQNFDYDLLTPQKLLDKAVGGTVRLYRTNPATGKETVETARVLAANDGAVLRIGDRIETLAGDRLPGRIVFDSIPDTLRAEPTLSLTLDVPEAGERPLSLTYMTGGLSWRADYVGVLSADETDLSLQGLVTLTNDSPMAFDQALTQLVAGDVNRVRDDRRNDMVQPRMAMMAEARGQAESEALMDYHLYTLPERTTIGARQTKQVGFLQADGVRVAKSYSRRFYGFNTAPKPVPARVALDLTNDAASGLGQPLPAGIVRVYTADSAGRAQFVGEDRIDHTPKAGDVRLALGEAFDVRIEPKLVARQEVARDRDTRVYEATQRYTVTNARAEPVTVAVEQAMPGTWEILDESQPHEPVDARTLRWTVEVPAEGETVLELRARIR